MEIRYELFWFGRTGASWVDAAEDFDSAKEMMEKSFAADAGGYAVLVDTENDHCITVGMNGFPAEGRPIFP